MKFYMIKFSVLIILLSIILLTFLETNHNFAQTEKEMGKQSISLDYLGCVPIESTLAVLVPEQDKQIITLKEKWLDARIDIYAHNKMAISENGKFKILKRHISEKQEGVVEATFVDTNGTKIWNAVVGEDIYVSNNGRNIAVTSLSFPNRIAFYDVRASTEPITTGEFQGENAFSYNGEYFISAGSKLILRRADGAKIWEKDTGSKASKKVAISSDGSYIVMASNAIFGETEPNIRDVVGAKEQNEPKLTSPKTTAEEKKKRVEALKREAKENEGARLSKKVSQPTRERKVYLSFLRGDGTLIKQFSIPYRIAQNLALSYNGQYLAFSCDSTVLFYQVETGDLLWKYEFPNVYWWIMSMAISGDGDLIALGVKSDRSDLLSSPYLYLLNKNGAELKKLELKKPTDLPQMGPIVDFTEDNRYLLVVATNENYLFEITKVSR